MKANDVSITIPCYEEKYARGITTQLYKYQGETGEGAKLMDRYKRFVAGEVRFEAPMGVYALVDGLLVGGLTFFAHNDWIFLESGYVDKHYRNLGIYTNLMAEVESMARREGLSGIYASTYTFEAPVLYEKMGFVLGGVMHDCPMGNTSLDYIKKFDVPGAIREPLEYDERVVEMRYLLSVLSKELYSEKLVNRVVELSRMLAGMGVRDIGPYLLDT